MKNYKLLIFIFLLSGCESNNNEIPIMDEPIKVLEFSKEKLDSNYVLEKQYEIQNLNVQIYSYLNVQINYPCIIIYDKTSKSVFAGGLEGDSYSYVYHIPNKNFHPYYSYRHQFHFLGEYLNHSSILEKRMITAPEMDSLVACSTNNVYSTSRINNINELKKIIKEAKKTIDASYDTKKQKEFVEKYLDNGLNFLSEKIKSSSDFMYQLERNKILLLEVNHGVEVNDENFNSSNLKYHLDVYEISPIGANLYRLLEDAGLR
jgi:hypothetical protein